MVIIQLGITSRDLLWRLFRVYEITKLQIVLLTYCINTVSRLFCVARTNTCIPSHHTLYVNLTCFHMHYMYMWYCVVVVVVVVVDDNDDDVVVE